MSGLKVTETRISFTFTPAGAPFPAHFSGSYIAGDDRVTGTFSLRGNSRFVKFKRVPGSEVVPLAPGQEPPDRLQGPLGGRQADTLQGASRAAATHQALQALHHGLGDLRFLG